MKKLILVCMLLGFSLSSYASDSHVNMKSYHKAITKLGTKSARKLARCHAKMDCVDSEYDIFVKKREKLLRQKLQLTVRHFQKLGKKTLKDEAKCVKESPSKADMCFEKYEGDLYNIISSIN